MEITLEKIELVKDRTGVSYKEAKEALEKSEGSVVDAIICIEEGAGELENKTIGTQGQELLNMVKEVVRKGNVSKISVKKDGEPIVNIPINVGIIGAVLAPWGMLAGIIAAFGTKCSIEIIGDDGSIVDVSSMANDAAATVKEKSGAIAAVAKDKGGDALQKGQELYQSVKEKAEDTLAKVKADAPDLEISFDEEEIANIERDFGMTRDEVAEKAEAAADELGEISDKLDSIFGKNE